MTVINKVKAVGVNLLQDDKVFYGLIIGFVAVSSFGLGRISAGNTTLSTEMIVKDNVAVVAGATAVVAEEGTTTSGFTFVAPPKNTETVYVGSKNSDKYHLPWCSGAKQIAEANKVFFNTKAEAEAAGYTPAANCKGI